uniref:Uncharacterized protein n=1 Tax=Chromera velia CCMP2878 TaxID=1169474 RepID=A0A0G4G963_9ALVE|eukprot:Cvel_20746.t1-p1 / transcript=Cvel_20746.t1 / gene=Cvel_20746 / organism=Chromera_velia_CCMP2878 / gene_product=hypothetical protein / transcript_product=hypothetical protein / location=Cvel_scaffold1890:4579-6475(-) / protein_length=610 / sequence_SO=supercontig / SO=protein_coding / is_pseudo=false
MDQLKPDESNYNAMKEYSFFIAKNAVGVLKYIETTYTVGVLDEGQPMLFIKKRNFPFNADNIDGIPDEYKKRIDELDPIIDPFADPENEVGLLLVTGVRYSKAQDLGWGLCHPGKRATYNDPTARHGLGTAHYPNSRALGLLPHHLFEDTNWRKLNPIANTLIQGVPTPTEMTFPMGARPLTRKEADSFPPPSEIAAAASAHEAEGPLPPTDKLVPYSGEDDESSEADKEGEEEHSDMEGPGPHYREPLHPLSEGDANEADIDDDKENEEKEEDEEMKDLRATVNNSTPPQDIEQQYTTAAAARPFPHIDQPPDFLPHAIFPPTTPHFPPQDDPIQNPFLPGTGLASDYDRFNAGLAEEMGDDMDVDPPLNPRDSPFHLTVPLNSLTGRSLVEGQISQPSEERPLRVTPFPSERGHFALNHTLSIGTPSDPIQVETDPLSHPPQRRGVAFLDPLSQALHRARTLKRAQSTDEKTGPITRELVHKELKRMAEQQDTEMCSAHQSPTGRPQAETAVAAASSTSAPCLRMCSTTSPTHPPPAVTSVASVQFRKETENRFFPWRATKATREICKGLRRRDKEVQSPTRDDYGLRDSFVEDYEDEKSHPPDSVSR